MLEANIVFIGAGNMASSLIGGLLAQGVPRTKLKVADPKQEQREKIYAMHGVQGYVDNQLVVQDADIIVLAVKPQSLQQLCRGLRSALTSKQLIISIAAGVSCASLQQWLGECALVRCMPNTPALIGEGMSGLFASEQVSVTQRQSVEQLLQAVGLTVWVEQEAKLDAVTAVSGSGPAYFFLLMEAMIAAGIKLGLSADEAEQLTLQTALGAARMAMLSAESAAVLRQRVTSPKGTTEAAIQCFQAGGFSVLIEQALQAAAARSLALTKELG